MTLAMDWEQLHTFISHIQDDASYHLQKIPGSAIALRYVKSSYQNDPIRSAIELFLFLFALRYLLSPYKVQRQKGFVKFSEDEIDDLVDDWTPEPLVASVTAFEEAELEKRPVIVGPSGPKTRLSNGRTVTNLASYNFYNLVSSEHLKESAISTLRTYGVGPCGPPGFYGMQDVHIKTEADVAAHIGSEACIIYAQSFSTISSVIPAFAKRGDIIVADKAVGFAIRKGLQISRSTIRWFEHNDMDDLEKVLKSIIKEQRKKPLTRRFIVTEALFENTGDMVDLPRLVDLKTQHKFRLILDETYSYGVLGRTGAGLTEHANVDPMNIDMIIGSLAGPLCSGGGFCASSADIVEHQRIGSASYCFSAALPAMLSTTASETISMLQTEQGRVMMETMRENVRVLRAQLDPKSEWVRCSSAVENAIQIVCLKEEVVKSRGLSMKDEEMLLQEVCDEALTNNVLITRLKLMPAPLGVAPKDHGWQPQPALKICVTNGLSKKEVEKAAIVVRHVITRVMSKKRT